MRNWIRLALFCVALSFASSIFAAGPATRLVVNCIPSTVAPPSTHCFDITVGKPITVYVIAADANYQVDTTYAGTVHVTSSDPIAALPPDHTFTPVDAGIY